MVHTSDDWHIERVIRNAARRRAKILDLSDRRVTSLPQVIGELAQLEELDLRNNDLGEIPQSMGGMAQLRVLILDNKRLRSLPESIGQLHCLERLELSDNSLTVLPESIGQLSSLQLLALNGNRLSKLPSSIGSASALRFLDLTGNNLKSLPHSIGNLKQLHDLRLGRNQLTRLPKSIAQLVQLETLYVGQNRLVELPSTMRKLYNLAHLNIMENVGLNLPPEIVGSGAEGWRSKTAASILDYYFRLERGQRPLCEAKLILVGRGGAGKTSLVNRLLFDAFDKDEDQTHGIQITEWKLSLGKSETVRLNVWDFGGQEIMHATHQFFLTERSLYLLVLSGREGSEESDAEYWLRLISSFGGKSPVIVAMNKINEHPFDLNRRALQQKFPFVRAFIRTDCCDRVGIEELKCLISSETDQLEHVRTSFPSTWFAIKDRLAGMKKNYLTYDRFRVECRRLGEDSRAAQDKLAGFLHCLGIALNYRDDARLRDTHVLNPHWVTRGIYTILSAPQIEHQRGELCIGQLAEILDGSIYPPEMNSFLIDLMKKFELCFSFPEQDTRYLTPELLDIQEPDETYRFDVETCLNFEYRYPILPEGLLPRLIVRSHTLSANLPRWRRGVMLQFEENLALVRADVQDRTVQIFVKGPKESRRRLLAIIRSDLERIHDSMRKLRPTALVRIPGHGNALVAYDELCVLERHGERTLKKVVDDGIIEIDVQQLLNGVDLGADSRRDLSKQESRPLRVFYSYSHKDERLRNELETHLKLLERQGLIETWHDRLIGAGDDWQEAIDSNLRQADVVLLLVSPDFLASEYCYEREMTHALSRHESGESVVIPVILRQVDWQASPLGKLQALPKDALPVRSWEDRDLAWRSVSEGIAGVIRKRRAKGY